MACKNLNGHNTISTINDTGEEYRNGRLHFFFHSPSSKLPIRDVLGENKDKKGKSVGIKTEPHIEIGAENYCKACLQKNIKGFIDNKEKYLFLMTTCRNKQLDEYDGKRFIVGYILRASHGKQEDHWYIKGKTYIYSFKDALNTVDDLKYSKFITRTKKLNRAECEKILKLLKGKDILLKCIKEIQEKDKENLTCTLGKTCEFKNDCLRWKHESNATENRY